MRNTGRQQQKLLKSQKSLIAVSYFTTLDGKWSFVTFKIGRIYEYTILYMVLTQKTILSIWSFNDVL
jgi:hypothetical protein